MILQKLKNNNYFLTIEYKQFGYEFDINDNFVDFYNKKDISFCLDDFKIDKFHVFFPINSDPICHFSISEKFYASFVFIIKINKLSKL